MMFRIIWIDRYYQKYIFFFKSRANIINVVSPFVVNTQSNYKVIMFIISFKNIVTIYMIRNKQKLSFVWIELYQTAQ